MVRTIVAAVLGCLMVGAISIAASAEIPYGKQTLWDTNSNFGYSVVSQNFSTFSKYNSQSAGLFLVPRHTVWSIKKVVVSGTYLKGSGPANSEIITFYNNGADVPGKILGRYTVDCTEHEGSFACRLPQSQRLSNRLDGDKIFWLSFVVNCARRSCGEWGWTQNTTTSDVWGDWRNPSDGFGTGCVNWLFVDYCWGSNYGYGFAFALIGTAKPKQR